MSASGNERRRFQRIEFDAPTTLKQGERSWNAELLDISLKGLLIKRPEHWNADPNENFTVQIDLTEDTHVVLDAVLTRFHGEVLGFVCRHIDLDSISHLRRLVELNLGDDSLLERELAALGDA
ncbi:PilZ domain-containing protein [Pseudomonas sp. TTU2014-080ASC]|uniref:PilZ domain-containing protein n=1 Tax=Pseudomonas sp. TTU2014-080ASC TaxID=1729724 RepID=UPI0007183EEA|nr:PilZ domain-containing protein [Pseudomonas sp. TTU2014-080ASC]KRW62864.1 pilus assembly protein [Pseudomonas sp. TTU2014-080ASC]